MKEGLELLNHIYEDTEMSIYSIKELLKALKDKDNKIKKVVENLLKEYESYEKDASKLLKKKDGKLERTSMMSKLSTRWGIKATVEEDNSDSKIADMLIKGIDIGIIDMEKIIKDCKCTSDRKSICLAKDFLEFQKSAVKKLKKFL